MATNNWIVDANGDWATAANWSTGSIPVSSQDVTISTANIRTITHGSGNDTVKSLTVGADHFQLTGGSLEILTSASFATDFTQTNGSLLGAATVTVNGGGFLSGGYAGGTTAFKIAGTIAITNYTLGGGATLVNNGTTNQTGGITIGDNSGVNAKITNSASGTYNISTDGGIGGGASSATFVNAGLLTKASGTGTSTVSANITDTGTITVATGTLNFTGSNNSFSGSINGPGTFAIGGGTSTIASGTSITTRNFSIGNAVVSLAGSLSYGGAFSFVGASPFAPATLLTLGGGTLTLSGAATLATNAATPTILGTGTLLTSGTTTVTGFVLGGAVVWQNTGTISATGNVQIGDASANKVRLANTTGATYNLIGDVGIGVGANATSNFNNNGGTLAKASGNGTSTIAASFQDGSATAAQIQIGSGTLNFIGSTNSFNAQTISGAGTFEIGGGVNVIGPGTTISTANMLITGGASVTLAQNLSYAGSLNVLGQFGQTPTITLGGYTLTLSGPTAFTLNSATPVVTGAGTMATSGVTTLSGLVLGGAAVWQNTGTVNATGTLQIGDGSGNKIRIANATGGTYNLTGDNGIAVGSNAASNFNNNGGTLAKTGGSGISTVSASFQDGSATAAQIQIASGTLNFAGATNSFNAQTISGAGTFEIGGGVSTLGPGTSISSAGFLVTGGASVTLAQSLTYGGVFTDLGQFGQTPTITLGGNTLTLNGTTNLTLNSAAPLFNGSGTLKTTGTTNLSGLTLGGTVIWQNTGTVGATGSGQIGDAGGQIAQLINAAGGAYRLTGDVGIGVGANAASTFNNNGGTLAKTAGTGTSAVSASYQSSSAAAAQIQIGSGTLNFVGATNTFNAQAISGAGTFELSGGANTIGSGTTITSAGFLITGTVSVTLAQNLTYGGIFTDLGQFGATPTVNLGGNTLTLNGTTNLTLNSGSPLFNGAGTLKTTAVTNLSGLTIGGTAGWQNTGTVNQTGTWQIGDASGQVAQFTNAVGGSLIIANDSGVNAGAALSVQLNNSGSILKSGGTGMSVIGVNYANTTGTTSSVEVASGTLDFGGAVLQAGGATHFTIDGNAALEFDRTVGAGAAVTFGAGSNTMILGSAAQFSGAVSGFGTGDKINLQMIQSGATPTLGYTGNASGGTLTVADTNGHSTSIAFTGNYNAGSFTLAANGGSTNVVFA